jgi:hypothetical protein
VNIVEGCAHLRRRLAYVPEHSQPPAEAQYLGRLGRSGHRIYPVPRLPGDDRVERPAGRIPDLELGHLDIDPALPGQFGHACIRIDPEHPAPRFLELAGRYAGAAADIENVAAGAAGDDAVYQGLGIAGPGSVVALGVRAEAFRDEPVLMRLVRCGIPCSLIFG